ncbi:hypothetical protein F4777DRAFT_565982 [Nemania sp. FL0916]|nr:hypothetical protein F4777DRAFT_565982 [Nemania sp. FL0916]
MDASLRHIDDEDLALIVKLLQTDSEDVVSAATGKGKQPEGAETDAQVAINFFLEELRAVEMFSADKRMTMSIQSAIQVDSDAIIQSQYEEQVAEQDRNLSISLSNEREPTEPPASESKPSIHDDELIDKMKCIYITGIDSDSDSDNGEDFESLASVQPETSAWAASRQVKKTRERRTCEACQDRKHFAELCRAPCNHEYCRQCLERLFRDAMVDESLFPPRCCRQPIPLDKSQLFLIGEVVQEFREKALEFSTPNRTYCHNASCASFIPPMNYLDMTASCDNCQSQTCTTCKRASHIGDCPNDEQLQQVLQLAREQGWQRCQNCWGMVELNTGCNHMTCRCGFQFCYVCGSSWKTCDCEQWDEHRLFERAAQIEARDHGDEQQQNAGEVVDEVVVQPLAANRRQRIQTIAQNLRYNHECDHDRWIGRGGPQICEECHDIMPLFIYECRQCQILACRRCRYHRL